MYPRLFNEFLAGDNTLQAYEDNKLIFASNRDRMVPLVEYIENAAFNHQDVVIFDRITGRAAALLCAKANCRELYSPLGSQLAIEALDRYGIKHHLTQIVPYIQRPDQEEMCPMEKLSTGKEPEEFYQIIKNFLAENRR